MAKRSALIALLACLLVAGCVTPAPELTSLELQAIQAREFETSKKVAFAATLSVFQDLGYVISSADVETGFISAKSPTRTMPGVFVNVMTDTKATAFVEQMRSDTARVRLNFVRSQETSGAYGEKTLQDRPLLDTQVYQNAFTKIREAVFIRTAAE